MAAVSTNPITAGPRAVFRDPVIILLELLWRSCFVAVAGAVLFAAALALSDAIKVSDADAIALRSRDALQITLALRHAVAALPARLLTMGLLALFLVTVLWTLFSATGRLLVLGRTAPEKSPFRFRSILIIEAWRAVLAWLAIIAIITVLQVVAGIAGSKKDPDPYFFYLVGACSSVLMAALWAGINWYLSLATIFCYAGTWARGAVRETIGWVNVRAADLAGISLIFFVFRLALMAVAFVFLLLPSRSLAASPRASYLWIFLMALFYVAATDFLNISRLLSYMSIEDAIAEEIVQAPLKGPGSSHRPPRF